MSKLLATGCSITHGEESSGAGFMSQENVRLSFSAHVSNSLNLELLNVAMSGASNEYIFHSLIENLEKNSDITVTIVVWTSLSRIYWKQNNRHWFFLPSWACTLENLQHQNQINSYYLGVKFTADLENNIKFLQEQHKFFVENYFDELELLKKLQHYRQITKLLCEQRNIKLIDFFSWDQLYQVAGIKVKGHPTKEEHKIIADGILRTYFK